MFANTQMMGVDIGFPDVCKTPTPAQPVPITYPAGTYEINNSASKVSIISKTSIANKSEYKKISGDETGTLKGMVSSMTMGKLVGNAPLLKHLVDKAHAMGFQVIIAIKNKGRATLSLQNSTSHNNSDHPTTRGVSRTYMARSGTEGMEWLLRRLH